MKQIELTQRSGYFKKAKYTLVDDADYEWLNQFNWCLFKNIAHKIFYAEAWIGDKQIKMHQLLMPNPPKGLTPDHKDGDGLNNQRENLRWATVSQQGQNRKLGSNNSSGFKGVSWSKRSKKWRVNIMHEGTPIHLGLFYSKIEAAKAYNEAAIKYFGEFAKINEIPPIQ